MRTYVSRLHAMAAVMIATLLTACGSDGGDNGLRPPTTAPAPTRGTIEIIHASADAPPVNVLFDGVERITGLDYKGVYPLSLVTGDISVQVDGQLPGDNTVTVIPAAGAAPVLTLDEGARISVIALGNVADIAPRVLVDPDPEVPANEVRLRVLHAAPDVIAPGDSMVEVWLTNPTADITAPAPGDTIISAVFEFSDLLTPDALQLPAGDYRIRVTLPGQPAAVAFDSGTVPLPGGANLVVVAVPNTNVGSASPVSLVVSTGAGDLQLQSEGTQSTVRAVHASSDAPPVDILVNGALSGLPPLAFGAATITVPLAPGSTDFDVAVSPYMMGDTPVISATVDLLTGGAKTIFAVGSALLDPANAIEGLVLDDATRSIATEARVRIVHASVLAQDVDIYVQPAGTLLAAADIPADIDPTFSAVPFKADTGYVPLADARYDIAVTAAGEKTPAIGPLLDVPFAAGSITTIVAVDGPNLTTPLGVLVLDDAP